MLDLKEIHQVASYMLYVHNHSTMGLLEAEVEGRRYARFEFGPTVPEAELRYAGETFRTLVEQGVGDELI